MHVSCRSIFKPCWESTPLNPASPASEWAGFEVIAGVGLGATIQLSAVVIQGTLASTDIPSANALILLANDLSAALAVSIAQNILTSTLRNQLEHNTTHPPDTSVIFEADVTKVSHTVPMGLVDTVREVCSIAVRHVFVLPVVVACLAFLAMLGVGTLELSY